MIARPDDDALSWDGDDDPTLDTGAPASVTPAVVGAVSAQEADVASAGHDAGDDESAAAADDAAAEAADEAPTAAGRAPMGNATLIAFGVLIGFYALFTLGWILGGLRLQGHAQYLVADVMFQGSFWLAAAAPALWFGTVLLLTRRTKGWIRMLWLIAGAVLLVPWPFVMIGAVGQ